MSLIITPDRGFLPNEDPLERFSARVAGALAFAEDMGQQLPDFIAGNCVRQMLEGIPEITEKILDSLTSRELAHANVIYTTFLNAYRHIERDTPLAAFPRNLARPSILLAKRLERQPILHYGTYALDNWARIDKDGPIVVDNLRMIQPFVGTLDERWFMLIHIDIIARAGLGIAAGQRFHWSATPMNESRTKHVYVESVYQTLNAIAESAHKMNMTMARMPEHCRYEVYHKEVRPWLFSFRDVAYDGVSPEEAESIHGVEIRDGKVFFNFLRGETGAQDSNLPAFDALLRIVHEESALTKHTREMRFYMPREHRELITHFEERDKNGWSIREFVLHNHQKFPFLLDRYNRCILKLHAFRMKHYEYAQDYIEKYEKDPEGTGGTPYTRWLKQMAEETLKCLIEHGQCVA